MASTSSDTSKKTAKSSGGNGHVSVGKNSDGDGRNIDFSLARLVGEGAQQQRTTPSPHPDRPEQQVWKEIPSRELREGDGPSYYNRPVVKEPVWIWTVPLYFFVGGAAGAAAVLGTVASWFGGHQVQNLVTRCRWVSAVGANIGALLLIADLGRPERFLNMLRIFRPTSPMSVGSWILTAAGGFMSLNILVNRGRGWLGWVDKSAGAVNLFLGMGLSGYTAVLLTNSAIPIWLAARRSLPVLFVASSVASAASLLELAKLNPREARMVRYFGLVGRAAEVVSSVAVEREVGHIERVGRPLQEGRSGWMWKVSKALGVVGLLMALLPGNSPLKRRGAAIVTTVSSLLLRYAFMSAGQASARDPQATFQQQRAFKNSAQGK